MNRFASLGLLAYKGGMTRIAALGASKPVRIYFDGGSRPNPGRIEVAVVARGRTTFFDDLGEGSSSDAEWLALLCAVEVARDLGAANFDLLGDSRSIIDQADRIVPCRTPAARTYLARFNAAIEAAPPRRLRWTPRHQNLAGIALDGRRQRSCKPIPMLSRDD